MLPEVVEAKRDHCRLPSIAKRRWPAAPKGGGAGLGAVKPPPTGAAPGLVPFRPAKTAFRPRRPRLSRKARHHAARARSIRPIGADRADAAARREMSR